MEADWERFGEAMNSTFHQFSDMYMLYSFVTAAQEAGQPVSQHLLVYDLDGQLTPNYRSALGAAAKGSPVRTSKLTINNMLLDVLCKSWGEALSRSCRDPVVLKQPNKATGFICTDYVIRAGERVVFA